MTPNKEDKNMIIAVNMKNYKFGKSANIMYKGFGILDTETDSFISLDGFHPYTLDRKCLIQGCIDANWPASLKRVAHA